MVIQMNSFIQDMDIIWFHSLFLILNSWSKIVVTFGVDNSWLMHIDNNKKGILVLSATQRLNDTTIAEDTYSIKQNILLILHNQEKVWCQFFIIMESTMF